MNESFPFRRIPTAFPWRPLLFLLFVAVVLFFPGLGGLPLLEPDEGRNAEVAREMLQDMDWVTPHFNGLPYLDKPAVFFWLLAGSFRLLGISEWAARLPSALMALATILLIWFLQRRLFVECPGPASAIVFATCPLALVFARLVIFDMTLAFLVTLAMTAFWLASSSNFERPGMEILMFASMGLATITKGPVGFLLPLLSVLAFELASGRLRELKRMRWGLGCVVFLAATLPWFMAVSVRHPDFPRYALWQESLQRFSTGQARRPGGFLYYVPVYLAGFFPWSFFLLFAGWNRLRRWREIREERHQGVLFLLSWAVVIFLFFSISQSKLPGYFLPAIVPLSILTARVWDEARAEEAARAPDWLTAGFAACIGLGLLLAVGGWQMFRFAPFQSRLAAKIHPSVVSLLKPSLIYAGLILAAWGFVGRNIAARTRGRSLARMTLTLAALACPLLALRSIQPIRTYAESVSSRRLARTILASPEKSLPVYGFYYFRTSLPFYLGRPVGLVTAGASELTSNYVSVHSKELVGTGLLIDGAAFAARARSPSAGALVLVRNTHVGILMETLGKGRELQPVWPEWQDSVWEIPSADSGQR